MECKIIFQMAGLETLNEELVQVILGWVLPTQKSRWEAQVICLVKDLMAHLKSDPPLLSSREGFAGVPDFPTNPFIHFPLLCHICPQIWWVKMSVFIILQLPWVQNSGGSHGVFPVDLTKQKSRWWQSGFITGEPASWLVLNVDRINFSCFPGDHWLSKSAMTHQILLISSLSFSPFVS